ncbi:Transmembrane protease serine 11F [Eumeta japonica]|uniref:Transmembrane protease serine 11F n=1 Tax=Eumeta variegata TaxID=151549 RepID=A0A4C1XQ48_EUMVA|nr:Transmembrane protease serine 11F [Eumeta japonica]
MSSGVVALCLLATLGSLVDASPQPVFLDDVAVLKGQQCTPLGLRVSMGGCDRLFSNNSHAYVSRSPQRIVSGWEAEEGQIPHQLSIRMVNTIGTVSSCGASIIHNEWGLTAAHCTALLVPFK